MFTQFLHRFQRRSLTFGVFAVLVSSLVLLAVSTPAGASTSSSQAMLVPVAALSPSGVSQVEALDKRRKKGKKIRRRAMGAIVPKRQVNAIPPAGSLVASLPSSVDLSNLSVPVGDQGSVGSCVAWAINYAMLGWYSRRDSRPGQPFHTFDNDSSASTRVTAIVPTSDACELASAISEGSAVVTGCAFVSLPPSGRPNGHTSRALTSLPTEGTRFAVLTSGDATLADQAGASASASDGGPAVRGNTDRDVTVLRIDLAVPAGRTASRSTSASSRRSSRASSAAASTTRSSPSSTPPTGRPPAP